MRVVIVPDGSEDAILAAVPGAQLLDVPQLVDVDRLVAAFTPPLEVASPAAADQARRNAEARVAFLREFPVLDADEVAARAGSRATNRRATASRWVTAGQAFAVSHGGRQLYPAFQFDPDTGRPRPGVATVIGALRSVGITGWALALWWATPHDTLGWQRPADRLADGPDAVERAAATDAATLGR
ncbi:MAG TPA: hypothetical protein VKI20_08405 [Acidimicrobiales bacterium]|nr:hypothetical protein [Acidimicrobiales bacterium]